MKSIWILTSALACGLALPALADETTLDVAPFGPVHLYAQSPTPARVVLFVSGDGGWNQGVVDMARDLAVKDALVAGIDIVPYLKHLDAANDRCSYPAADFEHLSQVVQQQRAYPHYVKPVLVGYSSGATLVYATLVQAPPTTFKGGVSLGFCPDLPLTKPLCKGSGLEWDPGPHGKGYSFRPATQLAVPWIALQGTIDQVCDPAATQEYVGKVAGASVVLLPQVGHGYSVPRHWLAQFETAVDQVVTAKDASEPAPARVDSLADLPLTELPVSAGATTGTMVFWITGDGGYGVTDRGVAEALAARGVPVVVLNALHYFWKAKTPEQASKDTGRILRHYMQAWGRDRVICAGYSHGADVLPFVVAGLPADVRPSVQALALLGLAGEADFQFHFADLLTSHHHATAQPVRPVLERLRGLPMLCLYGTEDSETICRDADSTLVQRIPIRSGHRFGSNFEPIVDAIMHEVH